MIKFIFNVKMDHCEGSTASGCRQTKIFILDAEWSKNKNLFPGITGKSFSFVLMVHFSNIFMFFMLYIKNARECLTMISKHEKAYEV